MTAPADCPQRTVPNNVMVRDWFINVYVSSRQEHVNVKLPRKTAVHIF